MKTNDIEEFTTDPRSYVLSSMGLGIIWGWTYLYSSLFNIEINGMLTTSSQLALIWKFTAILTLTLFAIIKNLRPLFIQYHYLLSTVSIIFGAIGSVLWFLTSSGAIYHDLFYFTASGMFGISYALFLCYWAVSIRVFDYSLGLFRIGTSCIIAGIVYLIFSSISSNIIYITLTILPVLAWIFQNRFQYEPEFLSEKESLLDSKLFNSPMILGAATIFISLSLGLSCQVAASGPLPTAWAYSSIITGIIFYTISSKNITNKTVQIIITGLLTFICFCIAMVLPFSPSKEFATFLMRIGSFIMMSFVLITSSYVAQEQSSSIPHLVCIGFLCYLIPFTLGELLWLFWQDDIVYLIIFASVFIAMSAIILFFRSYSSIDNNDTKPGKEEDPFMEKVLKLSESYNLTKRECEIMIPLSKGYSLKSIAEMQSVSYNTIKAQVRSIYNKLDIHMREELIEMLDNQDSKE